MLADLFQDKVVTSEEAVQKIKNNSVLAFGGYTSSGYPKKIIQSLAERSKKEELSFTILTGANVGPIDEALSQSTMKVRRAPMIQNSLLSKAANEGTIDYVEVQMHDMPKLLQKEKFGKINYFILEGIELTKEGYLYPTSSIGMNQHFIDQCEKVIIEINQGQPSSLKGMHDIYRQSTKGVPLMEVDEVIGVPYLEIPLEKIEMIVYSNELDRVAPRTKELAEAERISNYLNEFLELEFNEDLPPLQTGFGGIARSVVKGLKHTHFKDIQFFCGILQEENVELLSKENGKCATTGSIEMTERVIELLEADEALRKKIFIRNNDVTNNSEVISRLGIVSLLSAIEVDIYGNVNLSHVTGNRVLNGLGGGTNFAHNAQLTIVLLPSTTAGGKISTIVPMVSHHDIIAHDVDVLITEHGVADLRGLTDRERAAAIINQCSGAYQAQLKAYYAEAESAGGHHPVLLHKAFEWHTRFQQFKTMVKGEGNETN